MIIKRFKAENFRNIEKCDIEFSPGVNLLYGKNAQGKTNVVEGIYYFSRGKSFRGREDKELVRFGSEGFRIHLEYRSDMGDESLEYAMFGKERLRKKNDYKISKVTEMIGSFKAVLFYPDDLGLVKDGPEERRGFLNVAASACYAPYIKYYSDYKKALENRNCILKMMQKGLPIDMREIESWSDSMAEYASHIYLFREDYVRRLTKYAGAILKEISDGGEELGLSYESSVAPGMTDRQAVKEEYRRILTSSLDREIAAGVTLFGPHRDDLEIKINGKSARSFASQGQQRSIVLALKLSEGEVIKEMCGEYPVFLFDDVLSELDERRRKYVLSEIGERQIIITCCDRGECVGFTDNEIEVSGGRYVSSYR
ncbi:MAG: DNA replication/repair protein RecF [Clostridia bacterium]|nr:DNA replication/repair protein RecF [Clostridia bacterium]